VGEGLAAPRSDCLRLNRAYLGVEPALWVSLFDESGLRRRLAGFTRSIGSCLVWGNAPCLRFSVRLEAELSVTCDVVQALVSVLIGLAMHNDDN
jgi:hypothetical protein